MPLWFDEDCMSEVLIDNDYLSDSEELDNAYEKDFAINSKYSPQFVKDESIFY